MIRNKFINILIIIVVVIILLPIGNLFIGRQIDHQDYIGNCFLNRKNNNSFCQTIFTTCRCFGLSYYSGFPGMGNKCIGFEMMCKEDIHDRFLPQIN